MSSLTRDPQNKVRLKECLYQFGQNRIPSGACLLKVIIMVAPLTTSYIHTALLLHGWKPWTPILKSLTNTLRNRSRRSPFTERSSSWLHTRHAHNNPYGTFVAAGPLHGNHGLQYRKFNQHIEEQIKALAFHREKRMTS